MITALKQQGITDDAVLNVMAVIPREKFLLPAMAGQAYQNEALPIGENQTISQPLVVAKMTAALEVKSKHRVLEIGTGCGYQTAVLCKLARRVFTIERFATLAARAESTLRGLGIHNFIAKTGDGSIGWAEQAPFERIMVTAAAPKPPKALLDQLAVHAILVIPVGPEGKQRLMRYGKLPDGTIVDEDLGEVAFVPLVGAQGVPEHKSSTAIQRKSA